MSDFTDLEIRFFKIISMYMMGDIREMQKLLDCETKLIDEYLVKYREQFVKKGLLPDTD